MTLGVPSTGEAGRLADAAAWTGDRPPRDEFLAFPVDKATFVVNPEAGFSTPASRDGRELRDV
ncbi:MAG: hypothetical protein V8S69_00465 [Dakarella massiliensis]